MIGVFQMLAKKETSMIGNLSTPGKGWDRTLNNF